MDEMAYGEEKHPARLETNVVCVAGIFFHCWFSLIIRIVFPVIYCTLNTVLEGENHCLFAYVHGNDVVVVRLCNGLDLGQGGDLVSVLSSADTFDNFNKGDEYV